MLVQKRRNKQTALPSLRKLLKHQGIHPQSFDTVGLASYRVAFNDLGCADRHQPGDCETTIEPRIRICRSDAGRESKSGSHHKVFCTEFSRRLRRCLQHLQCPSAAPLSAI
ncbi:MAG: hypothetical protein ACKVP5_00470 [Aestuariivirga sp.]